MYGMSTRFSSASMCAMRSEALSMLMTYVTNAGVAGLILTVIKSGCDVEFYACAGSVCVRRTIGSSRQADHQTHDPQHRQSDGGVTGAVIDQ